MSNTEMEQQFQKFMALLKQPFPIHDDKEFGLIAHYLNLNREIINNVLTGCIKNLNLLQKISVPHDVICLQAKLTQELNSQINKLNQRFIESSFGNPKDYSTWIKNHCDFATD